MMGPKDDLDDLGKRNISFSCRETNITGLVNITEDVTCSGVEEEGTAYRTLRGHLNDRECGTMASVFCKEVG